MQIEQLPLGGYQTNAYLVYEGSRGFIIDPGAQGRFLLDHIKERGFTPEAVLLTHAHGDHIGALKDVLDAYSIPVYLHEKEKKVLDTPSMNLGSMMGIDLVKPENLRLVKDGDTIDVAGCQLTVLHTPGHTPGSVCYRLENVLFSGDTLFQGSIGRTDFPGGNVEHMMASLARLSEIPENLVVLSGHGMRTDLDTEKARNPFMRELL